jgi:hypothetical protein
MGIAVGRRRAVQSALESLCFARKDNDVFLVHLPLGSGTPFMGSATRNGVAVALLRFRLTPRRIIRQGKSPSVAPPVPARSMATGRPKAIPARKAVEIIKE